MSIDQDQQNVMVAVQQAVTEVVGIDVGPDDLDRPLEDTGIDSLDLVEVIMVVEEQLDISTTQETFADVGTLREAIAAFELHLVGD